ncbi:efflux RND transporter permease subunit [Dyella mobilis]|uniref:Efflux RND transporter permease subunit n=1 Tax=Dyella mobilis TaxID=1849582 RepID=A0ABS2KCB8_9GAMM|nr:efflux RND transporter permease subunit [Dyella mobilis]MBM7128018.1 efflux RND transporter permease subunit [Dyella mobilis]GLR00090.1 acriflavin resistance protein [Dyella mobilis]
MNISGPFIRRPIGTSLLAMGVFVIGVICYSLLGVSALPDMQFPVIFVSASQAGASADNMAATVAAPLERHLGQVPGIDTMRSSSSLGSTQIFLMFDAGRNIDDAARDVQAAINAAQPDLPPGLNSPPSYEKANPNDDPVIAFALTSDTQSARDLYDVADSLLAQRLRQLDGVSEVDITGAATPAVRVDVNLRALNAMGISPDQLRNALTAANVFEPQGFLTDGKTTMAVQANDALHTAADFAGLVIATNGKGVPVRLKDIANVYDGQQDAYQAAWFQGKPAILMYVYKQSNANIIGTVDRVKSEVPLLRSYLQPGTHLTPYFDDTPVIRASLHEVQATLLISLAMVILVMALFLRRLAPTLIAAVAVPLSLAGAAVVMYACGFTLNNLTLLALVIAIGFVVDDAIVVIENIIRHIDQGMTRMEAALAGAREIGFTIISITASLVAVFIPLLFMSGITGMFFKEFTLTLVAAIVISALVSLTLTSSLCGHFLDGHSEPEATSRLGRALDRFHEGMLNAYRTALDFSLRHALLMSLTPLMLIGLTVMIVLSGQIKTSLFPVQDTGLIRGRATASATVSFQDSANRQQRLIDMLLHDHDVAVVGSRLGSTRQGAAGTFDIQLKTREEGRKDDTFVALARLSAKAARYPDLNVRLRAIQDLPSFGGGGTNQGAQYQISLMGNDSTELQEWLPKLVDQLRKNPKLRDVGSDLDSAGLQQNIVIDRDRAAQLGVSIGTIDSAIYDSFGQRQVSTIYSDLNQYKVVVNALPDQTATPRSIDDVLVPSTSGKMIRLSAFAHQVPGVAPTQVTHMNQYTTMDLSFNLAPGISMGEALQVVQATASNMRMPGDIKLDVGGDFRRFQQSQTGMLLLVFGAIVVVYIVLGILYESLIHPVTILSTLPAAGVGALLALWFTNTDLSVIAQIALVLLIGIVKKNAIMMIDFALVAQREHGKTPLEAAREASLVRFRPIMMTTMVAILAAVPIAVGLGEGSDLRRPLGIALIGGLLISQSLTLLSTPALYVIFSCLSERWAAWRARRREYKAARQSKWVRQS